VGHPPADWIIGEVAMFKAMIGDEGY